jgi:hypothetical protein
VEWWYWQCILLLSSTTSFIFKVNVVTKFPTRVGRIQITVILMLFYGGLDPKLQQLVPYGKARCYAVDQARVR